MGSTEPVVVVAYWQTNSANLDTVLTHIASVRPLSLDEPGCLGYEVFRGFDEPTTLLLVERYRDGAALDAHRNSEHYLDLVVGQILPLLTDRRVEILRPQ